MKKTKLISGIALILFASLISSCRKEKETTDLRTLQGAFTDVLSDNTFESIDNTGFRG